MIMKKIMLGIAAISLVACGGGGGGGGSKTTKLAFGTEDLSNSRSFALATGTVNDGSSSGAQDKIVRHIMSPSIEPSLTFSTSGSAGASNEEATEAEQKEKVVAEDIDGFLEEVFPSTLNVVDFAVPSGLRNGNQYVAATGSFEVEAADGSNVKCSVLASLLAYDENAECVFDVTDRADSAVAVATIRDFGYPDQYADSDALYFTTNDDIDGFEIHRFNGSESKVVESSDVGRLDTIIYGEGSLFAYDKTAKSNMFAFGNEITGFNMRANTPRYGIVDLHKPLHYKEYVVYPRREVEQPSGLIILNAVMYNTERGSIHSYGEQDTPACSGPESDDHVARHEGGVFWVGTNTTGLCEMYVYNILDGNDPDGDRIDFREVAENTGFINVKYSNGVLVGIIEVDENPNTLIIDSYEYTVADSRSEYAIDETDKKFETDLDDVTGLRVYKNGVVVDGVIDGEPATRYCNTLSGYCDFNADTGEQVILKNQRKFN